MIQMKWKMIQMKWKMKDWDSFADCKIKFEGSGSCDVHVTLVDIPDDNKFGSRLDMNNITQGWREMIFKRLHQVFGYPLRKD